MSDFPPHALWELDSVFVFGKWFWVLILAHSGTDSAGLEQPLGNPNSNLNHEPSVKLLKSTVFVSTPVCSYKPPRSICACCLSAECKDIQRFRTGINADCELVSTQLKLRNSLYNLKSGFLYIFLSLPFLPSFLPSFFLLLSSSFLCYFRQIQEKQFYENISLPGPPGAWLAALVPRGSGETMHLDLCRAHCPQILSFLQDFLDPEISRGLRNEYNPPKLFLNSLASFHL